MKVKIKKWGNSLAVRVPKTYATQMGITENSEVFLELTKDKLIIKQDRSLEEMLANISNENRHEILDVGESSGKEMI